MNHRLSPSHLLRPAITRSARFGRWLVAVTGALLLSACATDKPPPLPPTGQAAPTWYAPLPHGGATADLASWWETFHDPALAELQQRAQHANPDLEHALAAIRHARADLQLGQAASRPQLGLQSELMHSGDLKDGTFTATSASHVLDASWETDLFGRNRRTVASLDAERDARGADWHAARVSIAAEVAGNYVDYRGCRRRVRAYRDQDSSYRRSLALTHSKVDAGFTSPADFRLTAAGASGAAADLVAEETRCETLIKSLVALGGLPEPQVRTILGEGSDTLPVPGSFAVTSLPAELLQQRPDLAAAERRMAAAYQRIGAAQAARWPALRLTGSIGIAHALAAAAAPWSIATAITLPAYTAGADEARVDAARADYDALCADYQALIRRAVQELEVALVRLDGATRRAQDVAASAENYRAYFQAAEIDWEAGRLPLLELETARRNALSAELLDIDVKTARLEQWIALYKALGGGWNQTLAIADQDERTP